MIKTISRQLKATSLAVFAFVGIGLFVGAPTAALAAPTPAIIIFAQTTGETNLDSNSDVSCPTNQALSGTQTGNGAGCILRHIVAPIVAALVALTGVLVVISIIIAGIQYSSSNGDPSKVTAARKRILNAVIALLSFMFLYAFVNWIIPGGIANGGNVQNGNSSNSNSGGNTTPTNGGGGHPISN
ncbi:MAG TPA: hypothetical protein VLG16_03210 [Candidatus Saccharimonadales bacterium]|nr:hypothetical protein [Candidatus Saccharimonadales bacterium]